MSTTRSDGTVADWFGQLFEQLVDAYPTWRTTARQAQTYAQALADLTPDQVRQAMARAVRESAFPPSVATLRSYVATTAADAGLLAWASLERAAAALGCWTSVQFDDEHAAEALVRAVGGWPQLCALEEGPAKAQARQLFLAAYTDALRHAPYPPGVLRVLPGLAALQNGAGAPVGWIGRVLGDGTVHAVRAAVALPAGDAPAQLANGGGDGEGETAGPDRRAVD